jgi:hypothetical protein
MMAARLQKYMSELLVRDEGKTPAAYLDARTCSTLESSDARFLTVLFSAAIPGCSSTVSLLDDLPAKIQLFGDHE